MGWREEIDGVEFRCIAGTKSPDDLVIEWYTDTGWRRPTFNTLALLVDFLYENEDVLYPPPNKGGQYLLDRLEFAAQHGYTAAKERLAAEKVGAKARPVPAGRRTR